VGEGSDRGEAAILGDAWHASSIPSVSALLGVDFSCNVPLGSVP